MAKRTVPHLLSRQVLTETRSTSRTSENLLDDMNRPVRANLPNADCKETIEERVLRCGSLETHRTISQGLLDAHETRPTAPDLSDEGIDGAFVSDDAYIEHLATDTKV